jgi:DNA-directed RNA polymerase specialized sigma24 family protein
MDNEKLKITWFQLWRFAITLGLPSDDAKDIVQNALINTLKTFDPERGEFLPLARTAVRNLTKNYWRDKERHGSVVDPDLISDSDTDEDFWIIDEQQRSDTRELEAIVKKLDAAEQTFLKTLGELLHETEGRMVLEASRKCGLTPDQGWNLMRKIQRKARRIRAQQAKPPAAASMPAPMEVRYSVEMSKTMEEARAPSGYDEFRDVRDLARDIAQWDSFRNFMDAAPADILKKLQSIV